MQGLVFLKLGGSLITNKDIAHTALVPQIDMLLEQLKDYIVSDLANCVLLGHGSGSFGHHAAKKYGTRDGVTTPDDWLGFSEVWREARALDQIILDRANLLGMKAVCFPFSSSAMTDNHQIVDWDVTSLQTALDHGLLPVIYGDVSFDKRIGGTIVSTEEQFEYLAPKLKPQRILLAGIEPGIWSDFPACTELAPSIKIGDLKGFNESITGSASIDVTGGMASKVQEMFNIISKDQTITAQVFSGKEPGSLLRALHGEAVGTMLAA